jgi:hypothetical protein
MIIMQVTHGNRFRYASVETFQKAIRVLTSKLKHFETYRKSFIAFISKVVKNNVLHCDSFMFWIHTTMYNAFSNTSQTSNRFEHV